MIQTTIISAENAQRIVERLSALLDPVQLDRFRGVQAALFVMNAQTPNREVPAEDLALLAAYITTGVTVPVVEVAE